jgi:hypothetical protein
MKPVNIIFITVLFFLSAIGCLAQTKTNISAQSNLPKTSEYRAVKATPAYAEILLRKTELESLIESFSVSYTEEFPKVKEANYELKLIEKDISRLLSVKDPTQLTLALGKLIVRRAQLETDLWALQTKFGEAHPDVVRAKRRVAIFDKAVSEILQ